jgi:hypothetical protein
MTDRAVLPQNVPFSSIVESLPASTTLLFDDTTAQISACTLFVCHGLYRAEKVLWITDSTSVPSVLASLRDEHGVSAAKVMVAGQLTLVTLSEYLRRIHAAVSTDPTQPVGDVGQLLLAGLRSDAARALSENFSGFRIVCDVGSFYARADGLSLTSNLRLRNALHAPTAGGGNRRCSSLFAFDLRLLTADELALVISSASCFVYNSSFFRWPRECLSSEEQADSRGKRMLGTTVPTPDHDRAILCPNSITIRLLARLLSMLSPGMTS